MRRVASTSRWAYSGMRKYLNEMQHIVFRTIGIAQPVNNEQIAYILEWPINRVTGRCTELHRMGFIQIEKIAPNVRGNKVKYWSIRDFNDSKLKEIK
jgi:hypothetical protein